MNIYSKKKIRLKAKIFSLMDEIAYKNSNLKEAIENIKNKKIEYNELILEKEAYYNKLQKITTNRKTLYRFYNYVTLP